MTAALQRKATLRTRVAPQRRHKVSQLHLRLASKPSQADEVQVED